MCRIYSSSCQGQVIYLKDSPADFQQGQQPIPNDRSRCWSVWKFNTMFGATMSDLRALVVQIGYLWLIFLVFSVILSFYVGDLRSYISFLYLPVAFVNYAVKYHRLLTYEVRTHKDLSKQLLSIVSLSSKTFANHIPELALLLLIPLLLNKLQGTPNFPISAYRIYHFLPSLNLVP
jgi:hypothetical protein